VGLVGVGIKDSRRGEQVDLDALELHRKINRSLVKMASSSYVFGGRTGCKGMRA